MAAALLAATTAASLPGAGGIDTASVATVAIGAPGGYAPAERIDRQRRGQSTTALPAEPAELWSVDLPAGLDYPPLVDARGETLAVLTTPAALKLGQEGRVIWQARLGEAPPAVAPALLSDGALAVLCRDGELWKVRADGSVGFRAPLRTRTKGASAAPLARDDGGVVVAAEKELIQLDAQGGVQARTELGGRPVGGLLSWSDGTLATAAAGEVWLWRPPGRPRLLGELGGPAPEGGVLVGPRSLAAVVEDRRLVVLDLRTGARRVLLDDPGMPRLLEGPPALDYAGTLLLATAQGELLGIDSRGTTVRQAALENAHLFSGADGGAALPALFQRLPLRHGPPLVVDPEGRVGFVRTSGRVGVLASRAEGDVLRPSPHRSCNHPIAVVPAGPDRMLVACHGGRLIMYGAQGGSILPTSVGVNTQEPIMAMATRIAWRLRERFAPGARRRIP
ncbi:MAG: PQQ-binding-like beta-propeller repeat protein [Deltaproteobacteria bacterium]|nr:PQQ-binding-like beta-propeller repeat protein [Deltaproteobacteria bacterium]